MCKRKPRPRCHPHARSALDSAQRRYDKAVARVETASADALPPSRVKAAQDRLVAAQQHLADTRVDADSTARGREALLSALADESLSKAKRQRLSDRFAHADALTEARTEQYRHMPDLPDDRTRDMDRAYTTLSESRDALARVDARLDVTTGKGRAQVADQRSVVTQRVFAHDVQYRIAASGGRPDPTYVAPHEQQAARARGPQAQHALMLLSHQRGAVADGGHDEMFRGAVADAEAGFRQRHMPSTTADARQPVTPRGRRQSSRPDSGTTRARSGGRGRSVLSSREAKMLLRKTRAAVKSDGKVTPGKHQGDPLGFLPEPV